MKLSELPITTELVQYLYDFYGVERSLALQLVSDLNCEDIENSKTAFGKGLVSLFCKSSEELQLKNVEDF